MFKNKSNVVGISVFLGVIFLYGIFHFLKTKQIPDIRFHELELTDLSGNPVHLSFNDTQYVFISFSTSWCPNCRSELQELTKFIKEKKYTRLPRILIISNENPQKVKEWKEKIPAPFEFYIYPNEWKNIGIYALPTNYLTDEKGKILKKQSGEINPQSFLIFP